MDRRGWFAGGLAGLLAWAASGSVPVQAQEPSVTPEDLEIYAAAADSTVFPEEPVYVLLEDGFHRIERDGRSLRRLRVVQQALTGAAAERIGEITLGYDPGREELELEWARVVSPDGTLLRPAPVHVQELDQPVARDAPVYSDRKVVRASLGDVSAGDIVDLRYTVRQVDPVLPGDVMFTWTVNDTRPVRRSRLVVDAPAGFGLHVEEMNLPRRGSVREEDGRVVRAWSYDDVEPMESEPFPADSNGVQQWIFVTGGLEWDDIARWYRGLSEDRYRVTPEMEARLAEVVAGAASLADSLRALHRWVAQDLRYVAISLGLGGYQPRYADEVLSTGVGDCKDKTTLFLALARHMGVEGHPIVVRTGSPMREGHVSIRQFNHMVAGVRLGGGWRYLDLTVPFAPFDEVPGGLQGRTGVMLGDDGTARRVDFPLSDIEANRSSIVVEGELTAEGAFDGTYTEVVTGAIQYRIRQEFSRPLTERHRSAVERGIAARVFDDARTDSLELFDGLDLERTPRIVARIRADGVLRELAGVRLLPLKLPRYGSPSVIARLEETRERAFPIDAAKVFGRREHHTEYRLRLPEGWTAELPADVRADGPFGFYESRYRQDGRELRIVRVARGRDGVLPPERAPELLEWMRTVFADHVEDVVLRLPEDGRTTSSPAG